MSDETPILVESQAVVVRNNQALDRPLAVDEIKQRLDFIKTVMARNMTEGQDYGKIPGCGDKPGLFQPGAQKLALTFQLSPTVAREVLRELRNDHREYEFTLAISTATGRVLANGVGTCSTLESKYRYRGGSRKCPECGKETIIKGKAEYGGGWLCFQKKGGCGAKWDDGNQIIEGQSVERVEHENPADFWNTVRKMAFKRALVHGMINATNTSELWSQDLEDLPEPETPKMPHQEASKLSKDVKTAKTPPSTPNGGSKNSLPERIAGLKTALMKQFGPAGVSWAEGYLRCWTIEGSDANATLMPDEGLDSLNQRGMDWVSMPTNWKDFLVRLGEHIDKNDTMPLDDPDNTPEPPTIGDGTSDEPRAIAMPQGCEVADGQIAVVSVKSGKKKDGTPWINFGIKIGDKFYGTFSKTLGDYAIKLKGEAVKLYYTAEPRGNKAVAIETPDGNIVQAGAT